MRVALVCACVACATPPASPAPIPLQDASIAPVPVPALMVDASTVEGVGDASIAIDASVPNRLEPGEGFCDRNEDCTLGEAEVNCKAWACRRVARSLSVQAKWQREFLQHCGGPRGDRIPCIAQLPQQFSAVCSDHRCATVVEPGPFD
jgi:hypothetical protein